tara:strand:- start:2463 stop:3848 length:1386 start_codon:yes stop_codon:yes gene_type:complete
MGKLFQEILKRFNVLLKGAPTASPAKQEQILFIEEQLKDLIKNRKNYTDKIDVQNKQLNSILKQIEEADSTIIRNKDSAKFLDTVEGTNVLPFKRPTKAEGGRIGYDNGGITGGLDFFGSLGDSYIGSANLGTKLGPLDFSLDAFKSKGSDIEKELTVSFYKEIDAIDGLTLDGVLSKAESKDEKYKARIRYEKDIGNLTLGAYAQTDGNEDRGGISATLGFNEGGRVGYADGSGKFPMSRRGFLAAGIGGLAALLTGGKSLTTGVKTGILASKAASEIAAPGMPSWFPLLVDKIYKNGTKIKNAQPGKGSIESVYQLDASAYNGIDDLRMYENANDGSITVVGRGSEGQEVSFSYNPENKVLMENGKQITEPSQFEAGEFFKGELNDVENIGDINDLRGDITNIIQFATRGSKESTEDAVKEFIKSTKTSDIGFNMGGLVPPKKGPMSSGMGTLFRQRAV